MSVSPGRWAAFRMLRRVESGAFAGDLLHSGPARDLSERDAAFATELVMGVLRRQGQLDRVICDAAGRPLETLDPEVRLALRLGVYQLHHLDGVPARAAVSEAVDLVKRARKASAASLVNAVLRKVATSPSPSPPAPEECVPGWILERWCRNFGDSTAGLLAAATLDPPKTYVRLNARCDPAETLRLLAAEGIETEPTELPLCHRVVAGRADRSSAFRDGRIRIQDLGSQRVAPLLKLASGHRFLDLCAAPGGKTFQALEQASPALAVACDLHHHRLLTMRRLATVPVNLAVLDATRPLPFRGRFDRILVDAPCSGTGTLARNPDVKWKLAVADLEDLATRQRAILANALELLALQGRLVYATCSLEPEENEGVVDAALSDAFEKIETRLWLPGRDEGDGFFACVIRRA